MHKKSPRGIPDFSRHKPKPGEHGATPDGPDAKRAAPPPPRTAGKPQATSSKAGRRGQ